MHWAIAPAGFLSSTDAGAAEAVRRGAAAGFGAGLAAGAEDPATAFFIRCIRLGWAGAGAGVTLVTLVATLVDPLHCALLALPALVQSYCRVVVVAVVFVVVVCAGVAGAVAAAPAPLQAALLAFPAFEQS